MRTAFSQPPGRLIAHATKSGSKNSCGVGIEGREKATGRLLACLLCCLSSAAAQSIAVTTPASNTVIAGFSYRLTCSVASISTLAYVQYLVDGETAGYAPALEPHTCPSLPWNTYNVGNGANHSFQAIALDASYNVLATSPVNGSVSVENYNPQGTCLFSDAPSNACTDIAVTAQPTASLKLAITGQAIDATMNVVSVKPSGGTPPAVVSTVAVSTSGQTTATTPGSLVAAGDVFIVPLLGSTTNGAGADALSTVVDQEGTNVLASTSTTGCTSNAHRQFNNSRICWVKPAMVHGTANYTVTATWSNTQDQGQVIRLYRVSGAAATNFIDAQVSNAIPGGGGGITTVELVSGGIALSVANESVFAFATHRPNSGSYPTSTAGPNFTLVQDANKYTSSEYTTAIGANWSGQEAFPFTVNGGNAAVAKTWSLFIDGATAGKCPQPATFQYSSQSGYNSVSDSATSGIFYMDTTCWYNIQHQVSILALNTNGTNCPGGNINNCLNGSWTTLGQWETPATFANPVLPVELTTSMRDEKIVCAGAIPSSCSSTAALTATVRNTDGSSTAASITSCVSHDTTILTVSSPACVPSPVALGSTYITVTDSNGLTRQAWKYVVAQNDFKNIGLDATVQTGYVAGNSAFVRDLFHCYGSLFDNAHGGSANSVYTSAMFAADLAAAGYNACEFGMSGYPTSSNESAYIAQVQADVDYACSVETNGLHPYFVAVGWVQGDGLFLGTRGFGLAYATPGMQQIYAQYASRCPANAILGNSISDEVTSIYTTGTATPCGAGSCVIGTPNAPTSIACVSGGSCTVTCSMGPCAFTSGTFIITDTQTWALAYNTTSGSPLINTASNITSTSWTWPTPAGVPTATYTATSGNCGSGGASSCANLTLQALVYVTYTAANVDCSDNTHNMNPGPCVDYARNNAFLNYHAFAKAGNSKALISYAPAGVANTPSIENSWCGRSDVADFCDLYFPAGNDYLPTRASNNILAGQFDAFRAGFGTFNLKPTSIEAAGVTADIAYTGYPVTVASCSGNTITTSSPHRLSNVVVGISRLWVGGSTGCNGEYYVVDSPTDTTLHVVQSPTFVTTVSSGTLTFVGGGTFTLTNASSPNIGQGKFNVSGCATGPSAIKNHRGQYFNLSTGNSNFDTPTWWYDASTVDNCDTNEEMWLAPNLTSTGGVAHIIPDHRGVRGRNWEWNTEGGIYQGFMTIGQGFVMGAAESRQYKLQDDTQIIDRVSGSNYGSGMSGRTSDMRRRFNDGATINLQDDQSGIHPHLDITPTQRAAFTCTGYINNLTNRLVPWAMQPSLPSPDYGQWYTAGARQDASGNRMLAIQQDSDNTTTLTVDLKDYLITGKSPIKYLASCDDGIVASTLSPGTNGVSYPDSSACPTACFVAYVFDNNPGAILKQPAVGIKLADVPGAIKVLIRYSYSPYAFDQQSNILPQVYDCGTGACTPPVDRNIGPIYYQIQYLDVNGRVLATGDTGRL